MPASETFQESFSVANMMCYAGCGVSVHELITEAIQQLKKEKVLHEDAKETIDSEPQTLGIHRLIVTIHSNKAIDKNQHNIILQRLKQAITDGGFEVTNPIDSLENNKSNLRHRFNLILSLAALILITALALLFPPSIGLTWTLAGLSLATATVTARHYLKSFYQNIRRKAWANMSTSVSLGWFFAITHTLYHAITMPIILSFSMIGMIYLMPIILMGLINLMDELHQYLMQRAQKMHLQTINHLFPNIAATYECFEITPNQQTTLQQMIEKIKATTEIMPENEQLNQLLQASSTNPCSKHVLEEGMLIRVNPGDCFPVDGMLVQGNTWIDASVLTGEPKKQVTHSDLIPAGAINLENSVVICAEKSSYHSTINRLLFRSNREKTKTIPKQNQVFTYVYSALIVAGILMTIIAPLAVGSLTLPMLLENITGILFAVCPCTIAIAKQLPRLLSLFQRSKHGITLQDEALLEQRPPAHTFIFDKTGTLTNGHSNVNLIWNIPSHVLQRVYLLEKMHGGAHPMAQAITQYYETHHNTTTPMIHTVHNITKDPQKRGLTATVQGKIIHIGNQRYLTSQGIQLPRLLPNTVQEKIDAGYSAVFIAEDHQFQGIMMIQHTVRETVIAELTKLRAAGKTLIMLTGDTHAAALGLNQQIGQLFAPDQIHADQTPEDKESFLKSILTQSSAKPQGVFFIGDGLNDAVAARIVSECGGISCSLMDTDKTTFFTDMSLNGTLSYLNQHDACNQSVKKITKQNQGLLAYGILLFLTFITAFSIAAIPLPTIIPLMIMSGTTLLTLVNSYRAKHQVSLLLSDAPSSIGRFLMSDWAAGLLITATTLFSASILGASISAGAVTFPMLSFSLGIVTSLCGMGLLTSALIIGTLVTLAITYYWTTNNKPMPPLKTTHLSTQIFQSVEQPTYTAKTVVQQDYELFKHPVNDTPLTLEQALTP